MKKYVLFLIGLFIFIPCVSAESAIPSGLQTSTNSSSYKDGLKNLPIKIYNDSYPNWDKDQYLSVFSYKEYPFIIIEFCSYNDTSYYVSGQYFYNYSGSIQSSQNIGKCSISGVNGTFTKRRAIIQIDNWNIGLGSTPSPSYASGTIKFRNQGEYSQYIEIQNIYLSDSNSFPPNFDITNDLIGDTNNKLDDTNNKLNDVNNKLNETNNYLKDDTSPDVDISSLGNVQGLLPPGPLDSLLNIPFQFLSILNSSFGGVCVPLSGTWVFDEPFTFPCFDELIWNNMPVILMPFINVIPAIFILIKYFKYLYKKVDRATSLESNSDDEWGVI